MDTRTLVTTLIAILSGAVAAMWAAYKYFASRTADRRRSDFEAFHRIVGSLPQGGSHPFSPEAALATIYELRNYPAYFDVTRRILEMYSARMPDEREFANMKREIKGTLDYIRANCRLNRKGEARHKAPLGDG